MESKHFIRFFAVIMILAPVMATPLQIVGSSAVYPFTTVAAEVLGEKGYHTPIVEATGTGGGIKLFCDDDPQRPDIVAASRPMTASEIQHCQKNGVHPLELIIGKDGIVIVESPRENPLDVSLKQLHQALTSSDIPFQIMGPSSTSGTRETLEEFLIKPFCEPFDCDEIRDDGGYIDAGENQPLILQKILNSPGLKGVLTYSFYEANAARLSAISIDGQRPTLESISKGAYLLSRPLYLYVNKASLNKTGMIIFLKSFYDPHALSAGGYLRNKGLIPLPEAERQGQLRKIEDLQ